MQSTGINFDKYNDILAEVKDSVESAPTLPLRSLLYCAEILCWSDDYTFCSSRGVEIKLYQNIFRAYETQRARTRAAAALYQR